MTSIYVSAQASPVERYAAGELRKYLSLLYRLDAPVREGDPAAADGPAIVVGQTRHHAGVAGAEWPSLSADGFCLRTVRTDPAVLVVAGGSGRGALFGVYELLERWGVRFLLSGDALPEPPEPLRLTGFDERGEPAYPMRAMRPMANLPEGSAPWGLADFTGFIDQMAKLKFNTFAFVIMESGPWLDYEFRGMKRPAGDIFYGYRFPIDDGFVGKELFAGQSEFYNPVLAKARNEEERKQLGIGLVRAIIAHCKSRDLLTLLIFSFLGGWGAYIIPYTFLVTATIQPMSVYLQGLTGDYTFVNYGVVTAIGLFQLLPVLIFYFFAQKYLLNLYSGGLKGAT